MSGFGGHEGHAVHPHDHSGVPEKRFAEGTWCSGRWFCMECTTEDSPRGTWFWGPECPRPVKVRSGK